jgi:parallel beta-helix repeat protein
MRGRFILPALLLIGACSSDNNNTVTPDAAVSFTPDAPLAKVCTVTLTHGASDQTTVQSALLGAHTGDLICFAAGTFTFTDELSLTIPGVTLRGATRDTTIFDFSTQATGGNALKVTAGDFIVEKLTIKDPTGDGIRAESVTNVTFRDVKVYWTASRSPANGAYGFYPVLTTNVLIENVEVSGASDAAIYVGQSQNIMVRNSLAHDSVAGIEIENSTGAEVTGNTSRDNTGGILVFNLPGLPTKTGANTKVHDNTIMNNNGTNFASGGVVKDVPVGTGLLILGADNTEVTGNTISGNNSVGALLVSCTTLAAVQIDVGNCAEAGYEGNPEGTYIHANTYTNNGTAPDTLFTGPPVSLVTGPSIFFDGLPPSPTEPDKRICFQEAPGTSFYQFVGSPGDITDYDCAHPSLPSINVTWGTSP